MIDKHRIIKKLGSISDELVFDIGETLKLIVGATDV